MAQQADPSGELPPNPRLADIVREWLGKRDPHFRLQLTNWNSNIYHIVCDCKTIASNMGYVLKDKALVWKYGIEKPLAWSGKGFERHEGIEIEAADPEFFDKLYRGLYEWHKKLRRLDEKPRKQHRSL